MYSRFVKKFQTSIDDVKLPSKLNYPFNYSPHEISRIAAKELQDYIAAEIEPLHEFSSIGKMFGVLVVKKANEELGYIAAFSGKLGGKNDYDGFVPPVYDMLGEEGFYRTEEEKIMQVSAEVEALENSENLDALKGLHEKRKTEFKQFLEDTKQRQKLGKEERKRKRFIASQVQNDEERTQLLNKLDKESVEEHYQIKKTKAEWNVILENTEKEITSIEEQILQLKKKRKSMSFALQMRLFDHYTFLNARKESKSLAEIFHISETQLPPSGAGECAAPKLLQYAFANGLTPISLAEFWWGKSPNSEIRKHGYFYPACRGKCHPILSHMLQGLEVEKNPLSDNPNNLSELEIVWEDEYILIVNKPRDFLSVPGKEIKDSVLTRMQGRYPQLKELMTVHRLDMSTSGIMLIAKTKSVHKALQHQFEERTIKKRYVAVLDGEVETNEGVIDLPLRVDFENRPRQLVCIEYGKPSTTKYKVIERKNGKTKIHFYPITGRTHQLRVHASHQLGLNCPIFGDDLYGKRADRLYLHAENIRFWHPIKNEQIEIQLPDGFIL